MAQVSEQEDWLALSADEPLSRAVVPPQASSDHHIETSCRRDAMILARPSQSRCLSCMTRTLIIIMHDRPLLCSRPRPSR